MTGQAGLGQGKRVYKTAIADASASAGPLPYSIRLHAAGYHIKYYTHMREAQLDSNRARVSRAMKRNERTKGEVGSPRGNISLVGE